MIEITTVSTLMGYKKNLANEVLELLIFIGFHHQFNLVQGSVLVSNGFSPLPIAVAGDRTVIIPEPTND
jgi:hypothetical protein